MLEFKCNYCGNLINRSSTKCEYCGAEVASSLEDAKKKEQENYVSLNKGYHSLINKGIICSIVAIASFILVIAFFGLATNNIFPIVFCILAVIMLLVCGFASYKCYSFYSSSGKKSRELMSSQHNFSVTCNKIEKYHFSGSSEIFNKYDNANMNQIAFNISITNISPSNQFIHFIIFKEYELLADGVKAGHCDVKENKAFYEEENNKEFVPLYDPFSPNNQNFILPGATLSGWIGFWVPKNTKNFELRIANEKLYLKNPYYEE